MNWVRFNSRAGKSEIGAVWALLIHAAPISHRHLMQDDDYITIETGSTASSMMQFLHQSILTILTNGLLDSSKFGIRSSVQVMTLAEVDTIVTDAGAPPDRLTALKSRGIDIRSADA